MIVWDRAEANRAQTLECDLKPPLYTFAGECLGKDRLGAQVVVGNAFACLAEDTKMVEEMIQSSVYNKQVIHALLYDLQSLTRLSRIYGISKQLTSHLYSQFTRATLAIRLPLVKFLKSPCL